MNHLYRFCLEKSLLMNALWFTFPHLDDGFEGQHKFITGTPRGFRIAGISRNSFDISLPPVSWRCLCQGSSFSPQCSVMLALDWRFVFHSQARCTWDMRQATINIKHVYINQDTARGLLQVCHSCPHLKQREYLEIILDDYSPLPNWPLVAHWDPTIDRIEAKKYRFSKNFQIAWSYPSRVTLWLG